jgi:hypothetical protein
VNTRGLNFKAQGSEEYTANAHLKATSS